MFDQRFMFPNKSSWSSVKGKLSERKCGFVKRVLTWVQVKVLFYVASLLSSFISNQKMTLIMPLHSHFSVITVTFTRIHLSWWDATLVCFQSTLRFLTRHWVHWKLHFHTVLSSPSMPSVSHLVSKALTHSNIE